MFVFLCCLVYFTSYLTRINYGAVLVEIIRDLDITKEAGSIAVTGSFITYGVGQLISGLLGDKMSPRLLIALGLCSTAAVNLSMVFLPDIRIMTVVWCFNGFFQAMLWPPLVKMMAENLKGTAYTLSAVLVSASASVSTIFVYLISPLLITRLSWRAVFVLAGSVGFAAALFWYHGTVGMSEGEAGGAGGVQKKHVSIGDISHSGIALVMIVIILQGILRDGITTWMPTYIKEVFDLGSSVSILTTVVLPIFSIASVTLASRFLIRLRDEMLTATILFGIALGASLLMPVFFSGSMIVCALLMALITGCMHGVNLMLISRLPIHFKRFGHIAMISGLLNACTYIGSALSTYGFAVYSERYGWGFIIWLWVAICVLGTGLAALNLRRWKRFTAGDGENG